MVSEKVSIVCPCLFHHNYQQIPVIVVEDAECFIIAIKIDDTNTKILINIKWKDVEGFTYGSSIGS